MELSRFVHLLLVIFIPTVMNQEIKPEFHILAEDICNRLTKDPLFEPDMVVGKPWRIYYSWNMKLDDKCMDMSFKTATPMIVNRIYNDMYEYLENQPYWNAATLVVSMGRARHEMLLMADQGSAGRFIGVPNVMRDGNISPTKNSVPLLKFHMKLIHNGRFLLMSDCQIGVTTLSARRDKIPYRAEIGGVVANLSFGDGFHACMSDRNKDETIA